VYHFNLPLSALAWCCVPFRLSKYRLSNTFPNINQTPKQNYPSQREKISRHPKENEPEVFMNTYPHTNLANNVISVYLIIWWPSPQLSGGLHLSGKISPAWKMSWTYCMYNHCFRCYRLCDALLRAINVNFGPPSENCSSPLVSQAGYGSGGDCCLVTSINFVTHFSLFTNKFFRFDIKF